MNPSALIGWLLNVLFTATVNPYFSWSPFHCQTDFELWNCNLNTHVTCIFSSVFSHLTANEKPIHCHVHTELQSCQMIHNTDNFHIHETHNTEEYQYSETKSHFPRRTLVQMKTSTHPTLLHVMDACVSKPWAWIWLVFDQTNIFGPNVKWQRLTLNVTTVQIQTKAESLFTHKLSLASEVSIFFSGK